MLNFENLLIFQIEQFRIFDHFSQDVSRIHFFRIGSVVAYTRKKIVLEELLNSSETEDMRKIRKILANSAVNILTEMCSQTIDFTELYS